MPRGFTPLDSHKGVRKHENRACNNQMRCGGNTVTAVTKRHNRRTQIRNQMALIKCGNTKEKHSVKNTELTSDGAHYSYPAHINPWDQHTENYLRELSHGESMRVRIRRIRGWRPSQLSLRRRIKEAVGRQNQLSSNTRFSVRRSMNAVTDSMLFYDVAR